MGFHLGSFGAAKAGLGAILAAATGIALATSPMVLRPDPAIAQSDQDWLDYCNSWFDKQIAAGKATEDQRSTVHEVCSAAQFTCMFKYGALYSLDPVGSKKKMYACFVEIMNYKAPQSGGPTHTKSSSSDQSEYDLKGCDLGAEADERESAIQKCSRIIETSQSTHARARAYAYRGMLELRDDNEDHSGRAMSDGRAAVNADPNLGEGYYVIGTVDANNERNEQAVENYSRAIALNPSPIVLKESYSMRGGSRQMLSVIRNNRDDDRLAVDDFTHALGLLKDPHDYRSRAYSEERLGQTSAAASDRAAAQQIDGKTE